MRLLVHVDQGHRRTPDGRLTTARPFVAFVAELGEHVESVALAGRLEEDGPPHVHELPASLGFVALPHYARATDPAAVLRAAAGACRRFWRALGEADAVWLVGPSPLSLPFWALAVLRRRPTVLGVRQDLPAYVRHRHPGRRGPALVADALDGAFRLIARRTPVVVVGSALAERFAEAQDVLAISVSLARIADVAGAAGTAAPRPRAAGAERRILSVGRLDPEKNPLLLADVLARLGPGWRLEVCGDGPLAGALAERLAALGVADGAELAGDVEHGALAARYRAADVLLHVSHTEGVPQVLYEAFAAGTPVVATDVGGVRGAAEGAALLVPPGDADAAVAALRRVAEEPALREALVTAGLARAREHALEPQAAVVAAAIQRWAAARRRRAPRPTSAPSRTSPRGAAE